ncbi:MAG: hypothetical protein ACLGSA_03485 [Acidobacteriota bacterium]
MKTTIAALALSWLFSAVVPANAQVTTLEQQLAIYDQLFQAAGSDPAALVSNIAALVPQYGNWCGLAPTPAGTPAIDCVDAACREHDLSPGYSLSRPTLEQVAQADRQFIASLSFSQASTPYGELFRSAAIPLFESKTTYEQANRVSLIRPCANCLSQP